MRACDHDKFIAAQEELVALEADAAELVKVVLDRLIISFDEELNEYCLQRESDLIAHDIPVYMDSAVDGYPVRTWNCTRIKSPFDCTVAARS